MNNTSPLHGIVLALAFSLACWAAIVWLAVRVLS